MSPRLSPRRRSLPRMPQALEGAAIVAIILAMTSVSAAGASGLAAAGARGVHAAGPCALPLIHDRYDGFHIGVPAGWELSTFRDTIAIAKDPSGSEEAIVYPALRTKGLTPAALFAAYSHTLQRLAATAGNALTFHVTSTPGQLPQAVVTGRAGHVQVQGHAMVRLLRYQTALAANQLVFSAYWAPTARIAADGPMLASIARCYGPEAGTLYQVFQDQVFAFALPEGWQVTDEGQDNVTLAGNAGRAIVSYLLTLLPSSEAGTTPRSLLDALFARLHIQITHILWSVEGPAQPTATGATQGQELAEFTGQYAGKTVHGLVSVVSSVGSGFTSGVMRLGMATTDHWNSVNSGLIKVMTSIRHSMAQDQQQWQHLTQQWQQFGQTTQRFDDVLNGVQEVRDPTTGQLYAAPYDTYDPHGPDGPGYYITDGGFPQRLQPVS